MSGSTTRRQTLLAQECASLSRYLVGTLPDTYTIGQYARFHDRRSHASPGVLDRLSVSLLRRGPLGARLVDSYTRRFRATGPAFEKLVVMLALLECRPASSELLAQPYAGSTAAIVLRLVGDAALDGLSLLAGLVVLGPVHLFDALQGAKPQP